MFVNFIVIALAWNLVNSDTEPNCKDSPWNEGETFLLPKQRIQIRLTFTGNFFTYFLCSYYVYVGPKTTKARNKFLHSLEHEKQVPQMLVVRIVVRII